MQVTAADRTRWQGWSMAALDKAYKAGAAAGLDPLTWQVGIHGLTGRAIDLDLERREEAFRAWADLLGLPVREVVLGKGHRRLMAVATNWGPGRCPVGLTAEFYNEETE